MSYRPRSVLVWFAVGGGAVAWALQHVAGLAFSFAECNQPVTRWRLSVHTWQAAVAAGGLLIALTSMGAALWLFRRTYQVGDVFEEERAGGGTGPPVGRVHFLAIVGVVVNFLSMAIIVMDGIGAPLLRLCQQS